jgi:hypothetical protein
MNAESYEPSPEEIATACARIRAGWSDHERQARLAKLPPLHDCDFATIEARAMAERQRLLAIGRDAV